MIHVLFNLLFFSLAQGQVSGSAQSCAALTAPSCDAKAKPLVDAMKVLCEKNRQELKCDQQLNSASASEKERFFSCDDPRDLCEQIEGAGTSRLYGCAEGVGGVVYEFGASILKIPSDIWNLRTNLKKLPRALRDCPKTVDEKKAYLGEIKPQEMTDASLDRMSCVEMQKFARLKVDVIMARIETRRQDEIAKAGNDQFKINYSDLSAAEKHAVDFDLQTAGALGKARCYRPEEAAKATCYEIGNLAVEMSDIYLGGKGAVKLVRSMVPAEAAGLVAREGRYSTIKMSRMKRGEDAGGSMVGLPTTYLTEAQEATRRLNFKNGVIYDSLGQKLNVEHANYIMDADGLFYASTDSALKHSSLAAGGRVASAGTITVKDGKLIMISRDSGHYTPSEFYLEQAVTELKMQDIDMGQVHVVGLDGLKGSTVTPGETVGVPSK